MKKQLILGGAALIAMAMTGCEKTGTVDGQVIDAFTGKNIEVPTVWMPNTTFGTHSPKYQKDEVKSQEIRTGKFTFENVPVGKYQISAKRAGFVNSKYDIETTEENPNLTVTLYEYDNKIDPGLYKTKTETPEKISSGDWVNYRLDCGDASVAGFNLNIPDLSNAPKVPGKVDKKPAKKGKKGKKAAPAAATPAGKMLALNAPRVVDAGLDVLFVNASSVTTPLIAVSYPAVEGKVADHKDCKGVTADEKTALFADVAKKVDLKVEYRAENLYSISGNLPKGKQIIRLSQDGKTLQTYYFEVK